MRRAARAHVVLRVDFEKPKLWARFDDRLEMLGLETNADARRGGAPRIAKVGDRHPQLLSGLAPSWASATIFAVAPRRVTSEPLRRSRLEPKYFPGLVTTYETKRSLYE